MEEAVDPGGKGLGGARGELSKPSVGGGAAAC